MKRHELLQHIINLQGPWHPANLNVLGEFDFRLRAIIDQLGLLQLIYREPPTTASSDEVDSPGKNNSPL